MPAMGRFFDGETGQRLHVDLYIDPVAETLRLEHSDLPMGSQYWPLWAIRALSENAREDQLVLSLKADTSLDSALIVTARLTVDDPDLTFRLLKLCPNLQRRDIAPGAIRKVAIWSTGAVSALLLMIFVILPAMANTLATFIPIEREVAWGRTVVNQMERFLGDGSVGRLACDNTEGLSALSEMTDRLTERAALQYDLNVTVFDHKMVNAFAAPGGQIVLMRGLIDTADSPDEVAAVLAHEIGHVESRDVTRNALRTAGSAGLLSLLLGDFAGGGAAVVVAEWTLNASYSREAEAQADQFALNMLDASGTDATGMAEFFDKIGELDRSGLDLPTYLASHPETKTRADAARVFAEAQGLTAPILSQREWEALRGICS
ncbi:metalloendopeptidase [Tateyamaria omphalii]|uniref:M48 family metallopeptidase n=1 Tax=Tateyamaria omphalii TaxID=299262 RepID=UPI0016719558|nr:M48 family metallopeptidase [Tateyamaria omphalii]GGX45040.1 metalloendopeptidase [Tateyamaria omphalii]